MRALRPHDHDAEAPEFSRSRGLVPLAAAGTLFLLGVFGIVGVIPFTGGLVGDESARSPGRPAPLVRPLPALPPEYNLDEITIPLWYPDDVPVQVQVVAEAEVLASSIESPGGVNAVEAIPPTPIPEPTATPTAEPTPTEEPTQEPGPTAAPTATAEGHFVPDSNSQQPAGVVGIVSSNPQPTPPGPIRQDPIENPGED